MKYRGGLKAYKFMENGMINKTLCRPTDKARPKKIKPIEVRRIRALGDAVNFLFIKDSFWYEIILKMSRGLLSEKEIIEHSWSSENWHCCLMCSVDDRIPRHINGMPYDEKLREIGNNFSKLWLQSRENPSYSKQIAYRLFDLLVSVDNRCSDLIS